jgi:hypothetical protein
MANNTGLIIGVVVVAGAIGLYWNAQKDKTPVGLVVVNAIHGGSPIGETSDGTKLTTGAVEGTWRADENSLPVISESAEKPLMVIYEDGKPIHAEVITANEWIMDGPGMIIPDECCETAPCDNTNMDISIPECITALEVQVQAIMEKWRKVAKEHGATEESIDSTFPLEETTVAEAESIFGPMLSLQSNFVW